MAVLRRDSTGNEFELRWIVCPTCGDVPQIALGLRGGATQRHKQGIETPIVQCAQCTLIFPNPFPFPVAPQSLYGDPDKYFERHDLTGKIAAYRTLARELVERCNIDPPSILDVGAGRGDFLHAAQQEGVTRAVGLEFSQAMIDFARNRLGVTLLAQSVQDYAATEPAPFDAVVLNAVLEHVYDPNSFIASVSRLTRPGSVVYVDVPNEPNLLTRVGNFSHRLVGRKDVFNLQPTWPPFHVFGFNPRALQALLTKHGFVIDSIRIRAEPKIPSSSALPDRVKSWTGVQLMRLANLTGTAGNLFAWARRVPGSFGGPDGNHGNSA